MKKIIIPFLLTSILNVSATNNEKSFFVNDNGVKMSESGFEHLLSMGFTKREINYMSQVEYNEKISLQIYNIQKDEYVVKTRNVIKDDEIFSISDEVITKETAEKELSYYDSQRKTALDDIKKQDGIYDEYKEVSMFGILIKSQDNIYDFFVKINVEWLSPPNNFQRGTDYIAIKTLKNVNMTQKIIGGNSYPDLESKFIYTKNSYYYEYNYINNPIQNVGVTEVVNTIKGNNIGQYLYKMGEGVAVNYNLPKDIHENVNELSYIKINEVTHTNFFFTLSANFTSAYSNINSTSFVGIYAHQKNSIPLLTGWNLTFIDNDPFILIGSYGDTTYQHHTINLFFNEKDFIWPSC